MEQQEIKQECLKLIESIEFMYLATNGADGFPQMRMMVNIRGSQSNEDCTESAKEFLAKHHNDFTAYMVTSHASDKMREIRSNPNVSLYYCQPEKLHSLLVMGTAEEVADMELKKCLWREEWKMYWPGGAEDPDLVLLKVTAVSAKGWYKESPFDFSL